MPRLKGRKWLLVKTKTETLTDLSDMEKARVELINWREDKLPRLEANSSKVH